MDSAGFHDVAFPASITVGARGGPRYVTDVTALASGGEIRQARWGQSLRQWDVAGAVTDLAKAQALLAFFEARQGRRFAFRFRDPLDHSSAPAGSQPSSTDQVLGTGDGSTAVFPLVKTYGDEPYTVTRPIALADAASLSAAVDGEELPSGDVALSTDGQSAVLASAPAAGSVVTAGFLFDVPVRFDSDELACLIGAQGASLPAITLREVRL
ncbi:MAG: DUF2460 domain-containing protein [Pseudomonadota bacterium]